MEVLGRFDRHQAPPSLPVANPPDGNVPSRTSYGGEGPRATDGSNVSEPRALGRSFKRSRNSGGSLLPSPRSQARRVFEACLESCLSITSSGLGQAVSIGAAWSAESCSSSSLTTT